MNNRLSYLGEKRKEIEIAKISWAFEKLLIASLQDSPRDVTMESRRHHLEERLLYIPGPSTQSTRMCYAKLGNLGMRTGIQNKSKDLYWRITINLISETTRADDAYLDVGQTRRRSLHRSMRGRLTVLRGQHARISRVPSSPGRGVTSRGLAADTVSRRQHLSPTSHSGARS